jgi:lysophospholipase L1-like esterase
MRAERNSTFVARHPIKRLMAAFAALTMAVTALPAGANVNSDSSASSRTLVILGASYAGSWGTPPLPGYRVVNRGVGGEQTGGMHARFERDVVAARPSAVLIWGHINNITQADIVGASPERIEAVKKAAREDYLAMLKAARAAGIEVMLATEIPMAGPAGLVNQARGLVGRLMGKQSYADQVNAQVRDLNTFVRQLAAREKLRLLDFEKVFAPEGGTRIEEYAQPDRSHVTPAGYQALTKYAVAELGKRR